MKVLISHDGSPAHFFDRTAVAKVLQYCGHQVAWWDCKSKPAFDIFNELGQVDIFYGQTYNLDRATLKCLKNSPTTRIILRAGERGDSDFWSKEKKQQYPVLIESQDIREKVQELAEEVNIDFLHTHYHPDYLDQTHGGWRREGFKVVSLMNAADIFDYTNGVWREEFVSDVLYVGSNWAYKSGNLNKMILPLCNPNLNLKIKIFGGGGWNVPQFMGPADQNIVKDLFKSAVINLAISEPHSTDFGYDVTEKIFKLTSNKSFAISDDVEGMRKIYGDSVVYCNEKDLLDMIKYYLENPSKRMKYINEAYKITLEGHTYFDRVISIFQNLNMNYEASNAIRAKVNFVKENNL